LNKLLIFINIAVNNFINDLIMLAVGTNIAFLLFSQIKLLNYQHRPRRIIMRARLLMCIFLFLALLPLTWTPAQAFVDLSTWSEKGPAANGTWVVSGAANEMVTETINGQPTFFVSPGSFGNVIVTGKMRVATTSDDDFIGFAFGYQTPAGAGNDYNLYLFDWKQGTQSSGGYTAQEGFTLSYVHGTIASGDYDKYFWGHTDDANLDVLGTNYGGTLGWADNTEYTFTLTYTPTNIKIVMNGGAFADTTIFDVAGSFPAGSFGFYNYSQAGAQYYNLDVTAIPLPGAVWLLGSGLAGLGALRVRRQFL